MTAPIRDANFRPPFNDLQRSRGAQLPGYDFNSIELRWQKVWDEEATFVVDERPDPDHVRHVQGSGLQQAEAALELRGGHRAAV